MNVRLYALRDAWALREVLRALFWAVAGVFLVFVLWWATDTRAQIPREAQAYHREYVRIIRSEWGLEAPIASLAAQLAQESAFQARAESRVGARGMAQFMPTTAAWIEEARPDLKAHDLYSPAWSMRAQAVYMKWLRERVRADNECERIGFVFQAYNSGLGWVKKRQALSRTPGRCFDAACNINPGVLPANQREAAEYPDRIERHWAPLFVANGWGEKACP